MTQKPLVWIVIGSVAAAGIYLVATRKKDEPAAPPAPLPPPPMHYGETVRVALAVPMGWRRVTNTEVSALPELGVRANALLSTPGFASMAYGTLTPFVASNGKTYATWVEQHYHEPGGTAKPWGLHHGVTLLAQS